MNENWRLVFGSCKKYWRVVMSDVCTWRLRYWPAIVVTKAWIKVVTIIPGTRSVNSLRLWILVATITYLNSILLGWPLRPVIWAGWRPLCPGLYHFPWRTHCSTPMWLWGHQHDTHTHHSTHSTWVTVTWSPFVRIQYQVFVSHKIMPFYLCLIHSHISSQKRYPKLNLMEKYSCQEVKNIAWKIKLL